jgi:hypothetical protein
VSASVGGVAAGALLAPLAVSVLGLEGTLIAAGTLTVGYGAVVFGHGRLTGRPARWYGLVSPGRQGG